MSDQIEIGMKEHHFDELEKGAVFQVKGFIIMTKATWDEIKPPSAKSGKTTQKKAKSTNGRL